MSSVATFGRRRLRYAYWAALMLVMIGGIAAVASMPTTTRQGVDFVVTTHELPLYAKGLDFIDRDLNYRALAKQITAGKATDETRVLAVFEWTRANIRDVPAGWPVIDDHIWHIIIRRYGVADQKADVFTAMATYAGVRGYWFYARARDERLPLSVLFVHGDWRVFDVQHGLVFRGPGGELLTLAALTHDPAIVTGATTGLTYHGQPYMAYLRGLRPPTQPGILHAEKQMLGPRLMFEMKKRIGLGPREWDPGVVEQEPPKPQRTGTDR